MHDGEKEEGGETKEESEVVQELSVLPPSILSRSAGGGRDHPADHPSAHCQGRVEQGPRV